MTDIAVLLNHLAELQAQRDVIAMEIQALKDSILTPEIKAQLAAVDAEFAPKLDTVAEQIAAAESTVKDEVLKAGASVKGQYLHAVYSKGRDSWDGNMLKGYALMHPEILAAYKQSAPSVSIRPVKG